MICLPDSAEQLWAAFPSKLRREVGLAPVIVFAAGAYGIFDIEEIMLALGKPPAHLLRLENAVQLE